MLKENAKKWVAALRSGKYKQGRNRLTHAGRYCCLGVGAAISPIPRKEWSTKTILPVSVEQWLGLDSSEGLLSNDLYGPSLAKLNDYEGKTFAEIADIIESEPEGLFAKGGRS